MPGLGDQNRKKPLTPEAELPQTPGRATPRLSVWQAILA
jgi:hypothetical protein